MSTHRQTATIIHGHRVFRRGLYAVPERTVPRAAYVPAGRTLHLLDLENLMGGPQAGSAALHRACVAYRETMPIGVEDHVIVAVNPALGLEAKLEWPDRQVILKGGPDGADLALLGAVEDLAWVTARYDRVVVGSGDGIFADIASSVRAAGIPVGVVACERSLAFVLARAATFVSLLPAPAAEDGAA